MNGRLWQYADIPAIAELEEECFSDPWNHRMLAESFLSGRFYGSLLEEDGTITAYGGVSVAGDELHFRDVPPMRTRRKNS